MKNSVLKNFFVVVVFLFTIKAQLKEMAYSPRNYKHTIPIQYTWPAGDQVVIQDDNSDMPFSQLRAGESLLEIHIKVKKNTITLFIESTDYFVKTERR